MSDELLDALRAAWREAADDAEAPPVELEACDADTRRAVGWVRRAWALDRDPVPPVPLALARAGARRRRRPVARRLAGAALVAAAAAAALVLLREPAAESVDVPTAEAPRTPGAATRARRDFAPGAFRSRPDGVELVRGAVRIVLVTGRQENTIDTTNDRRQR